VDNVDIIVYNLIIHAFSCGKTIFEQGNRFFIHLSFKFFRHKYSINSGNYLICLT